MIVGLEESGVALGHRLADNVLQYIVQSGGSVTLATGERCVLRAVQGVRVRPEVLPEVV